MIKIIVFNANDFTDEVHNKYFEYKWNEERHVKFSTSFVI